MGYFLAVTAVRSESTDEVARAVCNYMNKHGVTYEVVPASSAPMEDRDARLFSPINGWIVVLWPAYFNIHDFPLARSIGSSNAWLVCTAHVYDGDYWEHLAVLGSTELHSYCSRPHYWQDDPAEFNRVRGFNPSADRLAEAIAISTSSLTPYLVDVDAPATAGAKAYPDDRFALDDFWVFTDFWNRLGIRYPDPADSPASVVRLSRWFTKRLPTA